MTTTDGELWERWDEVDRLLEQVLDQPVEQRHAFLATVAGDDRSLHDLVKRLIDQLASDSSRFAAPPDALVLSALSANRTAREEHELEAGTAVGRYMIVGYLGRGGMATVYEAKRADGTFDQRVALKVLRRGLDTDDLIARFRNERQILSSLAHANVARLLDGGALNDGRPYLVMELVDGVPITRHADTQRLALRERLALFVHVANAVHAAHQQLVVHRDIKPSNILVSETGEVKLLDFGIAKLLDREDGHTGTGVRLLTPDYASPEQLRGDRITTSSDIYQLGLLLRELLTGLPPLAGDARSADEPVVALNRLATLEVPDRQSPRDRARARQTTPESLARALRTDLDIIVGKALRSSPELRYGSAEELAEDVRRYLAGRPILAHPESSRYLFGKFLARNRWVAPAAGSALLAVLAFITILAVQNRQLQRERDAAQLAAARAQATESFLVDMLQSPDPARGADGASLTVVDALGRGRARLKTELADQPLVRASLLAAIGTTLAGLGRAATADSVLRDALQLYEAELGVSAEPSLPVRLQIGNNYRAARQFVRADSVFRDLLQLRMDTKQIADSTRAQLLGLLSSTQLQLGNSDSALALASSALSIMHEAGDSRSVHVTRALAHLAPALRGVQQLDSSERVYGVLLERQLSESSPNQLSIALTQNNLGFLQKTRGDLEAAEASYRAALRVADAYYGRGHPEQVLFTNNLMATLEVRQSFAEVEAIKRDAIEAISQYWPNGDWRVGAAHLALGRYLLRQSRYADAIEPLRDGWQSYVASLGATHSWTVVAEAQLGLALVVAGRTDEGNRRLDRAYAWVRGLSAPPNQELQDILRQLSAALEEGGARRQATRFAALIPSE